MAKNIVDVVFEKMMACIANREWIVGHKIPTENELAERFGASRSSIRQAIARLKALDLIESTRGSGTVLKKHQASSTLSDFIPTILFEVEDNLQIFEFHKGIQIECAKMACFRYTEEQMERLEQHLDQMRKCYAQKDTASAILNDLQYHKIICEMSGNVMFVRATELINQHLEQSFLQICNSFDYAESIIMHERLIDALKNHNPIFAASLMESHQWDTYQKHLLLTQR